MATAKLEKNIQIWLKGFDPHVVVFQAYPNEGISLKCQGNTFVIFTRQQT